MNEYGDVFGIEKGDYGGIRNKYRDRGVFGGFALAGDTATGEIVIGI